MMWGMHKVDKYHDPRVYHPLSLSVIVRKDCTSQVDTSSLWVHMADNILELIGRE